MVIIKLFFVYNQIFSLGEFIHSFILFLFYFYFILFILIYLILYFDL